MAHEENDTKKKKTTEINTNSDFLLFFCLTDFITNKTYSTVTGCEMLSSVINIKKMTFDLY